MSTNHTHGPWAFDEDRFIVGRGGKVVVEYAGCGSHMASWPNKANKALVLAAPDMLEVLKACANYEIPLELADRIDAVILKATGATE